VAGSCRASRKPFGLGRKPCYSLCDDPQHRSRGCNSVQYRINNGRSGGLSLSDHRPDHERTHRDTEHRGRHRVWGWVNILDCVYT